MAVYDPGDRPNYPLAEGVYLEGDGYALTPTGDGNEVDLASGDDVVIGISFRSTQDETDDGHLTGGGPFTGDMQGAAVEFDGVVNVKCDAGAEYAPGDPVYLDADGVCDSTSDANTRVGTVHRHVDLSDEEGAHNVPVLVTGFIGGE